MCAPDDSKWSSQPQCTDVIPTLPCHFKGERLPLGLEATSLPAPPLHEISGGFECGGGRYGRKQFRAAFPVPSHAYTHAKPTLVRPHKACVRRLLSHALLTTLGPVDTLREGLSPIRTAPISIPDSFKICGQLRPRMDSAPDEDGEEAPESTCAPRRSIGSSPHSPMSRHLRHTTAILCATNSLGSGFTADDFLSQCAGTP